MTFPVVMEFSPGNVGDVSVGRKLHRNLNVKRLKSQFVLLDRAYEGDETRQTAYAVVLEAVVPPKRNRRNFSFYNHKLYKRRNETRVSFDALSKTSDESRRVTPNST